MPCESGVHKRRGGWQRKIISLESIVEKQQGMIDVLTALTRKYQAKIAELSAVIAEQKRKEGQDKAIPAQAGDDDV